MTSNQLEAVRLLAIFALSLPAGFFGGRIAWTLLANKVKPFILCAIGTLIPWLLARYIGADLPWAPTVFVSGAMLTALGDLAHGCRTNKTVERAIKELDPKARLGWADKEENQAKP